MTKIPRVAIECPFEMTGKRATVEELRLALENPDELPWVFWYIFTRFDNCSCMADTDECILELYDIARLYSGNYEDELTRLLQVRERIAVRYPEGTTSFDWTAEELAEAQLL